LNNNKGVKRTMRFLKLSLLVLCGLLLFSGSALALSVGGEDVGSLDTVRAFANVSSAYAAQLAWIQSVLGDDYFFSEGDKYNTTGSWTAVDQDPDYYALELNGTPEYYFIKLGTGGSDIQYNHWLYTNLADLNWAVVEGPGVWGTTSNIDILRISHIGEVGGSPVPEPATALLLGVGLAGLVGFGRKKFQKSN
jgi:hypothetical protein